MKSATTFLSVLSLALGVFQFAHADEAHQTALPVYQHVIADVNLGYDKGFLGGDIVLSEGLILHINDYKVRDDNVMKTWHEGDVVSLDSLVKNDVLVLTLKRVGAPECEKVEPYAIYDVIDSPEKTLRIVEVRDDGKFVKLTDNSVWDFSWYNSLATRKWEANQRIVVSGPIDGQNSYHFINLDASVQNNLSSATGLFVMP
jgi:hypothetical protein